MCSGGPNRTGLTGFTGPVRYPVWFGPVWYFPQIPNRTFLMKCVPKWYLRLDFTFKSSKVAIFFGQISEISFQSHLIFIIQSFRNFEAGYIWKFICYEVRFGKVRFGSVKITGPVRFGKSGICLVRSTTAVCRVIDDEIISLSRIPLNKLFLPTALLMLLPNLETNQNDADCNV